MKGSYKVECRLDKSKVGDISERNKLYNCGDKKKSEERSIFWYKSEMGKTEEKARKAQILKSKLQEKGESLKIEQNNLTDKKVSRAT